MTQKEKELVLIDLCSRLPNGVKCKILENNEIKILSSIQYDGENTLFDFWEDDQKIQYGYQLYLSEFKPYLFTLSSMNLDQRIEYSRTLIVFDESHCSQTHETYDWLNKNHFDYRGLIPMGLAIDATNLNIY